MLFRADQKKKEDWGKKKIEASEAGGLAKLMSEECAGNPWAGPTWRAAVLFRVTNRCDEVAANSKGPDCAMPPGAAGPNLRTAWR